MVRICMSPGCPYGPIAFRSRGCGQCHNCRQWYCPNHFRHYLQVCDSCAADPAEGRRAAAAAVQEAREREALAAEARKPAAKGARVLIWLACTILFAAWAYYSLKAQGSMGSSSRDEVTYATDTGGFYEHYKNIGGVLRREPDPWVYRVPGFAAPGWPVALGPTITGAISALGLAVGAGAFLKGRRGGAAKVAVGVFAFLAIVVEAAILYHTFAG